MQIGMNWQAEAIRNQTLATKVLFSWDTFFAPWLLPPESNDRFWIIRSTSLPAYIVAIEQCNADILVFVGWIISYRNGKTNEKQQHRISPSTDQTETEPQTATRRRKEILLTDTDFLLENVDHRLILPYTKHVQRTDTDTVHGARHTAAKSGNAWVPKRLVT